MYDSLKNHSFFLICTTFFLMSIFIVSNIYLMIPLLVDIESTFAQADWVRLAINSVFTFFYALGLLFFGQTCERFGLKDCLCFGLLLLALFMFLGFWATQLFLFLFLRALQGFFAASYAPVAYLYVFNVFEQKRQTTLVSIINAGFLSASVFGQIISSVINLLFPWQYVFIVFSFIYICLYFLCNHVLLSLKTKKEKKMKLTLFNLLKVGSLRKLYFVSFTLLLMFVSFFSTITFTLNNKLQLQPFTVLMIRIFSLLGIIFALLFIKKVINSIGLLYTSIIGLSTAMLGFALGVFPSATTIIISSICVTFGISLTIPAVIKLIETTAIKQKAAAISLYSFVLLLGASAGGLITLLNHYVIEHLSLLLLATINIILLYQLTPKQPK